MSKVLRVLLAFAFVFTAIGVGQPQIAHAQTAFPAYTSSIQVANLTSTEANITIIAYNENGSQNGTPLADKIPGDGSKAYFPISNVEAGFNGAIVVSSSQSIAAISNIVVSPDLRAGASYVGRDTGGTTVLLPLLNKNNSGFNTWFSVQNAGTAAANITIKYSDGTPNVTATIPVGAAKVFNQAAETHSQAIFAGTITSDQPVVAAVIQEANTAANRVMFAYTGIVGGTTNPVFPLINSNNSNYITGTQIQNAGTTATTVTVSYTPGGAGVACTETQTIQPGAVAIFSLFSFHPSAAIPNGGTSDCRRGERFIGSAKVTGNSASVNLVGQVNQLLPGVNGEAYNAFSEADASNVVILPLIMDRNSGFFTGINVQNVGTAATTVTCTFTNATYTVQKLLQPGEALNDIQQGKIADRYVGGGRCASTDATAKLVAVVNELKIGDLDQLLVYEGINKK